MVGSEVILIMVWFIFVYIFYIEYMLPLLQMQTPAHLKNSFTQPTFSEICLALRDSIIRSSAQGMEQTNDINMYKSK